SFGQARGRAERHALLQYLFVGESGELVEAAQAPTRGSSISSAQPEARQLGVPTEEVRDVLARLLESLPLRRRGVHGKAETDVAVARVTRLAPGRAIGPEMHPELRDVQVAEPDEQRQSHAADEGERLGGIGGHPHGRMGDLVRARRYRRVLEPVERARIAERLALPGLPHDRQRLFEPRLALAVWDPEDAVGVRRSAATDPEIRAAVAELV